jgi:hypothetical protein
VRLIAQEDLRTFICCEIFKTYIVLVLLSTQVDRRVGAKNVREIASESAETTGYLSCSFYVEGIISLE